MNRITWIIAACLIGAGIALNGYFVSQQGVYFLKYQEDAFIRAMQNGSVKSLDDQG